MQCATSSEFRVPRKLAAGAGIVLSVEGSIYDEHVPTRFAAKCVYLQMTMGSHKLGQGLINICRHIVRDGSECVGPFLDDTETTCGLWEPKQEAKKTAAQ